MRESVRDGELREHGKFESDEKMVPLVDSAGEE